MIIRGEKIFCDPSSEPSHQDNSDEGSQYMFSMRYKKNYPSIIIKYSSYLELCHIHVATKDNFLMTQFKIALI